MATKRASTLESILGHRWRRFVVGGLALLVLPFSLGTLIASQILIYALFVMGYNLLLGYGGEMSFGHAAYFGLGAYGTVLGVQYLGNLYLALGVGLLGAVCGGIIIGWFSLRRRGIYFSMITLAFAQMLYFAAFSYTGITGGSNGASIPLDSQGVGPLDPGAGGLQFYAFVLLLVLLGWFSVRRVVNSPFGRILVSIRENETRAQSLGYDTNRYLYISFVISAFISGLAGVLYSLLFSLITPNVLFWSLSGEVVLMAIIGGVGTLSGPFVGAGVFILLSEYLTQYFEVWGFVFGIVIVGFVMAAPEGIYGYFLNRTGTATGDTRRIDTLFLDWLPDWITERID